MDSTDLDAIVRASQTEPFSASYGLVRVLGRGGSGIVMLATQLSVRRPVAIKFLTETARPSSLERFLREGKLLASLTHPNVVPVFDAGAIDGLYYIVTEFLEGGSLRDRLVHDRKLPLAEAIPVVSACLEGLQECHDANVIHRDVKPENILFTGSGVPKLVDFGIARRFVDEARLTRSGVLIGTPHYLSPEAIRGKTVERAADVYAMGVLTYELLAGCVPFGGATIQDVLKRHLAGNPEPLESLAGDVPAEITQAVMRAISMDPADRPSARRFAEMLVEAANPAGPPPPPADPPEDRPAQRPASRAFQAAGRAASAPSRRAVPGRAFPAALVLAALLVGALVLGTERGRDLFRRALGTGPGRGAEASAAPGAELRASCDFPTHMRSRLRVRPARAGLRAVASVGGLAVASAAVDPASGEAWLDDLPPDTEASIVVTERGTSVGRPIAIRTPDVFPVHDFVWMSFGSRVLVDFECAHPGPVTVEVGPWERRNEFGESGASRAVVWRSRMAPGACYFHSYFDGFHPDADYFVRVSGPRGWGGVRDGRIRFGNYVRGHHWNYFKDWLTNATRSNLAARDPLELTNIWTWTNSLPDPELVPSFRQALASAPISAFDPRGLKRILEAIVVLREPELGLVVERFVTRQLHEDLVHWLGAALAWGRHPRAVELIRSLGDPAGELPVTRSLCLALARRGGKDACDAIAAVQEAHPRTRLMAFAVRSDPVRAREHAARFLELARRDRPQLLDAALSGLGALGDDRAISAIAALLEPGFPVETQAHAAAVLAEVLPPVGAPGRVRDAVARARVAVAAAFTRAPGVPALLWAAVRLGLADTAPVVARLASSSVGPAARRDAMCALGLFRASRYRNLLVASIADDSPVVASAAAWALAELGETSAVPAMLEMAITPRDTHGAAAWALGALGAASAGDRLARVLTELAARPAGQWARILALCWTLGRLRCPAAGEGLARLASRGDLPDNVRRLARLARAHLDTPRSVRSPPFEGARLVLPIAPFVRTGVFLMPGEAVSIHGESFYEIVSEAPGSPRPAPGQLPLSLRDDVSFGAVEGVTRVTVDADREALVASSRGEVLLQTEDVGLAHLMTRRRLDVGGLGWVVVETSADPPANP